eukprot:2642004-Rhodomonas_salina.7
MHGTSLCIAHSTRCMPVCGTSLYNYARYLPMHSTPCISLSTVPPPSLRIPDMFPTCPCTSSPRYNALPPLQCPTALRTHYQCMHHTLSTYAFRRKYPLPAYASEGGGFGAGSAMFGLTLGAGVVPGEGGGSRRPQAWCGRRSTAAWYSPLCSMLCPMPCSMLCSMLCSVLCSMLCSTRSILDRSRYCYMPSIIALATHGSPTLLVQPLA